MPFIRFINEKKGIVSIEFAVVLIAMTAITYFSMDTSTFIMEKNKLERVNYSLITLIRERTKLYSGKNIITQSDVNELEKVASKLAKIPIKIKVEEVYFDGDDNLQTISFTSEKTSALIDEDCFSKLSSINTLADYSVQVDQKRIPVFRVAICGANRNRTPFAYYQPNNNDANLFVISSIGIIR